MATSSNVMEKLPEGQMSQLKCQACDEGTQAIAKCIECDHFLCQECQRAHQRMGILKSHQIHTFGSDYEEQSSKTSDEMFTDTKKKISKSAKAVATSVKEEEGKLAEEAEQPHQEAKWKLHKSITTFQLKEEKKKLLGAYDVAAFSNNDIILADITNNVLVVISESKPHPEQLVDIRHFKNLQHIAVNKDDQLIVIDDHEVRIFNRQYEFLSQFKPERGSYSRLTCLAVDENNLIAVGEKNKVKGVANISLYDLEGTLIKTLPAPGIGKFLIIQTKLCIYWNGDKLHTMDYDGKTVCLTNIGRSGKTPCPTGMCFIRGIGFYIAMRNSSPSEPGEIHQLYYADQQTECVIQDCQHPQGVTVTPDGRLVVAEKDSLKIFRRWSPSLRDLFVQEEVPTK